MRTISRMLFEKVASDSPVPSRDTPAPGPPAAPGSSVNITPGGAPGGVVPPPAQAIQPPDKSIDTSQQELQMQQSQADIAMQSQQQQAASDSASQQAEIDRLKMENERVKAEAQLTSTTSKVTADKVKGKVTRIRDIMKSSAITKNIPASTSAEGAGLGNLLPSSTVSTTSGVPTPAKPAAPSAPSFYSPISYKKQMFGPTTNSVINALTPALYNFSGLKTSGPSTKGTFIDFIGGGSQTAPQMNPMQLLKSLLIQHVGSNATL